MSFSTDEINTGVPELLDRISALEKERAELQEFKEFCHLYLDAYGVPHHPPGTHGAEGCRIGDRLDWVLAHRDRLESARALLRELAAAVRERNALDTVWKNCDDPVGCARKRENRAILADLLSRAEAGAGEEKK